MKLLVQMEDPAYCADTGGTMYSKSVSARFFQFLKPYFDEISVCVPVFRGTAAQKEGFGFSWSGLPVRPIPLPYWEGIGQFWLRSPRRVLQVARIALASVSSHDVVWIRLPSESASVFYTAAYMHRRPMILHAGGNIRTAWRSGQAGRAGMSARRIASELMHRATQVMSWRAPTLLTGSELLDLYGGGAKRSRLFVDSQLSGSQVAEWRDTCGGPVVSVLFVGQLRRDKGVFVLLKALGSVDTDKEIVARIAGYGPLADELERMAGSSDTPHLRYEGYVQFGERLLRLYRESDIFVLPSTTYPEGFPRVILEAWSSALPVVASAVSGIRGIVIDEHNGLLVSPGSVDELKRAIRRIIEDRELRHKLIRNGLASAHQFTSEEQARSAMALLANSYSHLKNVWPGLEPGQGGHG